MGGQIGTTIDVTITTEHAEELDGLIFSHSGITAKPKIGEGGKPIKNQYTVSIGKRCPVGIYEARVMTRLGISTARAFNISSLPEMTRSKPNTSLATAIELKLNTICNAVMSKEAIDFYKFTANKGQRILVDCAARGIDSKLRPVVLIGDERGADFLANRRGGVVDFKVPKTGAYTIKLHDLTYDGGPYHFYRLAVKTLRDDEIVQRQPSTNSVESHSWPPFGLPGTAQAKEIEPNDSKTNSQQIELPCDIAGSFFPEADVDRFEFNGKKGDVWWVEVASQRLGLSTDPTIVIQKISGLGENETLTDIAELNDIPSPIKVSSNGYSYDGPPYNAGSNDILGSFEVKEDGKYRLQISDLFGGTRSDPNNRYRLIVRKAKPDFSVVAWSLHMNLRNGDRNALSKPFALRGGATMPIEVVVVRRDGFSGEINLEMANLPPGVSAHGIKIPAGANKGIMLISASDSAPRGVSNATFTAKAIIDGQAVTRPVRVASMKWPVKNAWSEIPSPRLLSDVRVSVCGSEKAPITIAAADTTIEIPVGQTFTLPLAHTIRSDFSGPTINLKAFQTGFGAIANFDVSIKASSSSVTLDLAKMKTKPGVYTIAFYGTAVAKYKYNEVAVSLATINLETAKKTVAALTSDVTKNSKLIAAADDDAKAKLQLELTAVQAKLTAAKTDLNQATKQLNAFKAKAKPKDIADIVVSTPIRIRVVPDVKKLAKTKKTNDSKSIKK